ncbi:MAG: serine/threonine protein kinase [Kofleriaceae bacterium]|nr:serine/threonine protein kinase [Kofleriaceae bacterium]
MPSPSWQRKALIDMPSPEVELDSRTTTRLEAWLETIRQSSGVGSAATLLPPVNSDLSLWEAFAATTMGGSAAPLKIGRTLAEGGMGIVKVAEQRALGRMVVVKTMRGEGSHQQTQQVLREAWATGALEHPNIVPVHDIRVDENGAPVIILKRIEGDSWADLMHDAGTVRERFGASDLLKWNLDVLRQITQAIRYAHSKGILHRDLKPDNVMIGEFGEVYLVDWGIALRLDDRADSPLQAARDQTTMAGTPCYLAPEMLGDHPLDHRTDIYLLGAVLFEILAGDPPHSTESMQELVRDIRASCPTFPDGISPDLESICKQAMAASMDERFEDASAFAEALRQHTTHRESELLAMEADAKLRVMNDLLASDNVEKQLLYQHFGVIRYAYAQSIDIWPDNNDAVEGLRSARIALIEFELGQENPQAALSILNELTDPPLELVSQVNQQLDAQRAQQKELDQFRLNSDESLGRRTRIFVLGILGVLWTIIPFIEHFSHSAWRNSYGGMIFASSALWAFALLLFFWARESLMKTAFNRKLSFILNATFPAQIVFFIGMAMLNAPFVHTEILMLMLWGIFAIATVGSVDMRFAPAALGYFAGFLVAARFPDYRFLAFSACHALLTINGIIVWIKTMKPRSPASADAG